METKNQEQPVLKVFNSFTKQKEVFEPHNKGSNQVTWYTCGPTVYDHSHMGHAKTYVTFDILRRILTDYFGYDIHLCMNITDIDDKIIKRSNEKNQSFTELARHFENEFFDDMDRLNVALPDVITRVSEYVPEIVAFIEQIIKNGYAYESNGSVYFDVPKFKNNPNHRYARMAGSMAEDSELLAEGEGVLAGAQTDKKDKRDFALWKKSKENEPFWESPWGPGRPGWHIECSAMASDIFKTWPIDIHTGGIDLRFPHHDNEVAQSEAYYECDNWINHFWHTGHLHIKDRKMSKSEKNFITIKECLQTYSQRQIRYVFLLHNWSNTMNYDTDTSLPEAAAKDKQFNEFFLNIKSTQRRINVKDQLQSWSEKEVELNNILQNKKHLVRVALCDSFDTATAIHELSQLVGATNKYLNQDEKNIRLPLIRAVSKYVFFILKSFGIYEEDELNAATIAREQEGEQSQNKEEIIAPYIDALAKYRDQVKETANAGPKEVFKLSDQLRDDVLPYLGIRLEDRGKAEAIWKYVDPAILIKEREAKLEAIRQKEAEKQAKKELELKKRSTPASEWFKIFNKDNYTQFDEQGIPTHYKKANKQKELEEKPIPDPIRNKLKKEWTKQDGVYKKWQAEQEKAQQQQEEQKQE